MTRRSKGLSTLLVKTPSSTARSAASTKPRLSPLPQTMSAPSASAAPGSVCAQQPHTARTAPGLRSARRRSAWRDFRPLSAVTAQLFTMTMSARSPSRAGSWPRSRRSVSMAWVSYWLTLQPRVVIMYLIF